MSTDERSLGSCAQYVTSSARYVIEEFGPRDGGSDGELKTLVHCREEMRRFTGNAEMESYTLHTRAFMGWLPVIAVLNILGVAAYWLAPVATAVLALLSLVIGFLHLGLYIHVLGPFFPKRTSHNVHASVPPRGEPRRRIILSGHADAAYEWRWALWHPKMLFVVGGLAVGGLLFALGVGTAAVVAGHALTDGHAGTWQVLGLVQLVFLPGFLAAVFFSNFSVVVPGANDNLTGTFAALAVAKYMQENDVRLENTEVVFLVTGSEEAGLRGAMDYVKRHLSDLQERPTVFLALETFRDLDHLAVYNRDLNGLVRHDPGVCRLLKDAGERCGLDLGYATVYVGATDAVPFTRAGIPAASLVAMDPAPPDYYHTRLDNWDNMDPACIEKVLGVILEAVRTYDRHGLPVGE